MKTLKRCALLVSLLALPATAGAQMHSAAANWYVAPTIGATFSGDTTSTGTTVGVAGGWKGAGWLGVEGEVASTTNFFEQTGFLTNRWVTTVMGNVLVGHNLTPKASVYGVAGYGLIRPDLSEAGGISEVKTNEPGFDVGAGAMASWMTHVGVRGDIRYFRANGNTDNDTNLFGLEVSKLHFIRVSAALVVGF